jgi:hypothetical protein
MCPSAAITRKTPSSLTRAFQLLYIAHPAENMLMRCLLTASQLSDSRICTKSNNHNVNQVANSLLIGLGVRMQMFKPLTRLSAPRDDEDEYIGDADEVPGRKHTRTTDRYYRDRETGEVRWQTTRNARLSSVLTMTADECSVGWAAFMALARDGFDVLFHRDLCHKLVNKHNLAINRVPGACPCTPV